MCGIAGIMTVSGAAPDADRLESLAVALFHRGPDGMGQVVSGGVGLVQTRLAIIDLETGDQPFYASKNVGDEKSALVANGEIYNYVELRLDMSRVEFTTRSDCEPPLHLYLRHGLGFARHLRGMYAMAIHDPVEDCLVLARDPFGIKPLYYAETDLGFVFASEPQALFRAGLVKPVLRPAARDELLQLQFTTGTQTPYSGIRRVAPGETLVIRDGRIIDRRLIRSLPEGPPESISETRALDRLDEALMNSVDFHQRSDVPYGMFLSGGIDSSALLALMARLNDKPVRTYTAGFPGTAARDPWIKKMLCLPSWPVI
ncbi:MAG: asparagine synthetase B, partial [Alphaproteobacteria bacterium]|nr:asparagine synthetase B [Alphaproteobacteria bacterium]